MARKKFENDMTVEYSTADGQARRIVQEYLCELREANDPHLAVREQIVREALSKLSVHGMQKFDDELKAMEAARKEKI